MANPPYFVGLLHCKSKSILRGDGKKRELEGQTLHPELQLKWGIRNTEIEIRVYRAGNQDFNILLVFSVKGFKEDLDN